MGATPSVGAEDRAQVRGVSDTPRGIAVATGTAADHLAIHRFLVQVFRQPSAAEFQAQLDEPTYEPIDRLLIKPRGQIAAHLRLIHREMRFGPLPPLPTGWIADLATLPEHRCQGLGSALLAAAEQRLIEDGQTLGLLRTSLPLFYARRGWVVCGRPSASSANPLHVLSHLSERESRRRELLPVERRPLHIRYWRHVERAALLRLYREGVRESFGPAIRRDGYWHWLIARRAYDRIYVALEGSPRLALGDSLAGIVGYAFMKEGRIVELMTAPRRPDAAERLLARACADAVESGAREIRLDAFPDHPLHQIIVAGGGAFYGQAAGHGTVVMAKLFQPLEFVARLQDLLVARLKAAGREPPCSLGVVIDGRSHRLQVTLRDARLVPGAAGRNNLKCRLAQWVKLLLGHANVHQLVAEGRVEASTPAAVNLAAVLFPQLAVWHPPLDDLPA